MTTLLFLAVVSLLVLLIVAVVVSGSTPMEGTSLTRIGSREAMRRASEAPYRPRVRWGWQITIVREERDK